MEVQLLEIYKCVEISIYMKRIIHSKKRRQNKSKALEDINCLITQAQESFALNKSFSKNCIALAKKLSQKYKTPLKEKKHIFCKKCKTILLPGISAQVRIKPGAVIFKTVTCTECGFIARIGVSTKNKIKGQ